MPTPFQWSYSWLTWVGVCEFCLFLELPKWFWCTARLQNHQCVISVPIYIISPAYRHRCMCAYMFHTSGKIQGNESICGCGCPYRRQMRPWSAAEGTQILHFKTTFFIVFEFFSMCGHWLFPPQQSIRNRFSWFWNCPPFIPWQLRIISLWKRICLF